MKKRGNMGKGREKKENKSSAGNKEKVLLIQNFKTSAI
jgi:hypothetical protein